VSENRLVAASPEAVSKKSTIIISPIQILSSQFPRLISKFMFVAQNCARVAAQSDRG